jgi:hypothetical protein
VASFLIQAMSFSALGSSASKPCTSKLI